MRTTSERLRLGVPDAVVDEVSAVVHVPSSPRGAGVFLVHGAGGDLDDGALTGLADALASRGHLTVRANLPFREAGRRGPPRAEHTVADYRATFAAARAALGPRRAWAAGGKSFGGRVASLAAAGGMACAGLVLVGYPLHPPGRPDRLRVEHWPEVPVPAVFLQGSRDPFGSPEELAPHVGALPADTVVVPVEGGDHSLRVAGKHAADRVPRPPAEVAAGCAAAVAAWLAGLP